MVRERYRWTCGGLRQAALDVWRAWEEFRFRDRGPFGGDASEGECVRHGAVRDAERCDAAAAICSRSLVRLNTDYNRPGGGPLLDSS